MIRFIFLSYKDYSDLSGNDERKCEITDYANAHGTYYRYSDPCVGYYWTRSPFVNGDDTTRVSFIIGTGSISSSISNYNFGPGVRPAITIQF